MFKIAKLEDVKNEHVDIKLVNHEVYNFKDKDKEVFKTLSFSISGDNYSFCFDLNCELDKLLEIPMNEMIDFKDYIFGGETFFNVNNENGIDPEMNINITRYIGNKFIIYIEFNVYNEYSGVIEFTFNLDDYRSE